MREAGLQRLASLVDGAEYQSSRWSVDGRAGASVRVATAVGNALLHEGYEDPMTLSFVARTAIEDTFYKRAGHSDDADWLTRRRLAVGRFLEALGPAFVTRHVEGLSITLFRLIYETDAARAERVNAARSVIEALCRTMPERSEYR